MGYDKSLGTPEHACSTSPAEQRASLVSHKTSRQALPYLNPEIEKPDSQPSGAMVDFDLKKGQDADPNYNFEVHPICVIEMLPRVDELHLG